MGHDGRDEEEEPGEHRGLEPDEGGHLERREPGPGEADGEAGPDPGGGAGPGDPGEEREGTAPHPQGEGHEVERDQDQQRHGEQVGNRHLEQAGERAGRGEAGPRSLREAAYAVSATKLEVSTRIVLPAAMSGVVAAVLLALARAVGETMIVLMAAGNTPVMEWNIFNGFRTLSANIAVELPEAVRNSTHYRTLFLAALVLFVITFILNTIAELIRMRFRKKAVDL